MKIIITGITSGLGRSLFSEIISQYKDAKIIGIGRNKQVLDSMALLYPNYDFKQIDLSQNGSMAKIMAQTDIVIHCAALSSPWGIYNDFYINNIKATKNLLETMKLYNVKNLIHISTPSIYYQHQNNIDLKEDFLPTNLKFINHYATTKYKAEEIIQSYQDNIKTIILTPRAIFGEYDTSLIPRIERIAKKGFLPIVKGCEYNKIDITYTKNVVHSIMLSIKHLENIKENKIFNITNDEPKTMIEIFDLLKKHLHWNITYKTFNQQTLMYFAKTNELLAKFYLIKEPLITQYGVGLISYTNTLDISKAKNELGYKPIYSIEEGIKQYAKWLEIK